MLEIAELVAEALDKRTRRRRDRKRAQKSARSDEQISVADLGCGGAQRALQSIFALHKFVLFNLRKSA